MTTALPSYTTSRDVTFFFTVGWKVPMDGHRLRSVELSEGNSLKNILVATDFSERSDRALRRATLLARQFEAALLLVHVVDDDQPRRIVDAERDEARM